MSFCSNCGTKLPDEAAFCSNCGVKIASAGNANAAADSSFNAKEAINVGKKAVKIVGALASLLEDDEDGDDVEEDIEAVEENEDAESEEE